MYLLGMSTSEGTTSDRDDELNAALELFFFGYRSLTARPDRILESRGLQRVHHRILYFVARRPALSVGELLAILRVTKQALHAPLRQLQQMRLVDSSSSPDDRRVRQLRLTAQGVRLERLLSGTQRRMLERVFGGTGVADEKGWRRVMERVAAEEGRGRD